MAGFVCENGIIKKIKSLYTSVNGVVKVPNDSLGSYRDVQYLWLSDIDNIAGVRANIKHYDLSLSKGPDSPSADMIFGYTNDLSKLTELDLGMAINITETVDYIQLYIKLAYLYWIDLAGDIEVVTKYGHAFKISGYLSRDYINSKTVKYYTPYTSKTNIKLFGYSNFHFLDYITNNSSNGNTLVQVYKLTTSGIMMRVLASGTTGIAIMRIPKTIIINNKTYSITLYNQIK